LSIFEEGEEEDDVLIEVLEGSKGESLDALVDMALVIHAHWSSTRRSESEVIGR
jgi:hypothetical protein